MATTSISKKFENFLNNTFVEIKKANLQVLLVGTFIFLGLFGIIFTVQDTQIQEQLDIIEVIYTADNGVEHSLITEIADTPYKRAIGLMDRSTLDADKGMLFIFETERRVSFWMKNTYIPLDIIYLDSQLQVVKIYENTTPNQTTELYDSEFSIKYTIEANAGWAELSGIEVGDFVRLN